MRSRNTSRNRILGLLFVALISQPSAHAEIVIRGSSTILPIVKLAVKEYTDKTGVHVDIRGGGSDVGLKAVLDGQADIGMVSRALTEQEKQVLESHLIGYDGIAIVVNANNPVASLSKEQVVAIFSGGLTRWQDDASFSMAITPIIKKKGRATRKLFDSFFLLQQVALDAVMVGSNTEVITLVGGNPSAIGYVSIGSAIEAESLGVSIKLLPLDGVPPTLENVANHTFPLMRELNVVTSKKRVSAEKAAAFVQYLQSAEGQRFVRAKDFITANK